jgi:hypothetical protein
MSTYREKLEAEIATLVREFLDSAEEHYGGLPHFDVYGIVGAVSFTPADEEPLSDEAFSRDAVSFRFSDLRQWAQVGVLQRALRLAEAEDG